MKQAQASMAPDSGKIGDWFFARNEAIIDNGGVKVSEHHVEPAPSDYEVVKYTGFLLKVVKRGLIIADFVQAACFSRKKPAFQHRVGLL